MHHQVSTSLSTKLIAFRMDHQWSQTQLARALNVSQGTVSRLEAAETRISDMKLLMTIAALLMCAVTDLLPKGIPGAGAPGAAISPVFLAFCPNVLCARNVPQRGPDGEVEIQWASAQTHLVLDFAKIEFCGFCGMKVIKACPSCGLPIGHAGAKYCRRCRGEIFAGPTGKEWRRVKRRLEDVEFWEEAKEKW